MSIYPTVRPSLTLDFQKSKQLDPRISFSRSSSATYVEGGVIKYADEHQARFEKEGLLIEESRTNLAENSEDFSLWTTQNSTLLTAQGTAPDGTNTAFKIQENTSTISHSIREPSSSSWSGVATLSCFVKPAGRNFAYMGFTGVSQTSITFDLVNKVSSYQGTNVTSGSVEDAGNGWLRIVAVFSSSITSGRATVGPAESDSGGGLNYTGDGSSGILAWGAQLEEGSFPTSYIPTSGSTVNRAADVCTITGDNFNSWYNQSEGTFAFEYNAPNQLLDNALGVWGAKSTNNAARLEFYTGNSSSGAATFDTSTGRSFQFLTRAQAVSGKYALAIKKDSFALSQNGNAALTDNSGDMNSTNQMVVLALGTTNNVNNQLYGHISRFTFYPRRLTDLELETLTL